MESALMVDLRKCTGCRICETSCSFDHEGYCNPSLSRIRVIADEKRLFYFPAGCAGCTEPVCIEVCIMKALSRDSVTGAVVVNEERCIGCKECITYCPFGSINLHPVTKKAFKCDLCNGNPVCAKRCPTGAITYCATEIWLRKSRRRRGEELHEALRVKEHDGVQHGAADVR